MRSRTPIDLAVQRIIETTHEAWQLDEQSVRAARQQCVVNRRKWIKAPPQDGLQTLATLALQAEIQAVRKTVVTVG